MSKLHTIWATWENFEAYSSQKSSLLHAVSEFVDNSIASYLKTHQNKIEGLHVLIVINTSFSDTDQNAYNQTLKIFDNAGGMDENELYHAMLPNYRKGKTDTQLNQYGVGMKLASFWLGRRLKIETRNRKNNQYSLDIDLTKYNLQDKAQFEIDNQINEIIHWFDDEFNKNNTGTIITVDKIRTNPDRIIKQPEIDKLIKGLGWRYSTLLSEFKLQIIYTSPKGIRTEKLVSPFKVKPYCLSRSSLAFSLNKRFYFDEELYQKEVIQQSEKIYLKHKPQIDKITGEKNFVETLKNDEPLIFRYKAEIESKEVIVEWGIIAETDTKQNYPYKLFELEGLTLLHNGRAIMHGPNYQNKDGNRIGTYSFLKKDASGGAQRFRWLFGTIDLTNVEKPDRNKSIFQWGPSGIRDIDNIVDEIRKSMIDIINAIATIPEHIRKPVHVSTPNTRKKIEKIADSMFSNLKMESTNYGADVRVDRVNFNNDILTFKMKHISNDLSNKPFNIEINEPKQTNVINVYINNQFYLWKDYINHTDRQGCHFKASLVYPLAAAFAICKIHYDSNNIHNDPVRQICPKLSEEITKMSFDEIFSVVLNYFKTTEEK